MNKLEPTKLEPAMYYILLGKIATKLYENRYGENFTDNLHVCEIEDIREFLKRATAVNIVDIEGNAVSDTYELTNIDHLKALYKFITDNGIFVMNPNNPCNHFTLCNILIMVASSNIDKFGEGNMLAIRVAPIMTN